MKAKKRKDLILVDKDDKIIGFEEKEKCHDGKGILHRAFTIFIFNNKKQILIQQRSKFKRLWPLYWETSCSSHPRRGETILGTAKKRLKEELNFTCPLRSLGKFQYQAPYQSAYYKNIGSENEVCALLVGKYSGKIKSHPKEGAGWKWIDLKELRRNVAENPKKYAPWLKISVKKFMRSCLNRPKETPLKKDENISKNHSIQEQRNF